MKDKIFIVSGGSSSIFQELLKKKYFNNDKIISIYSSSKNLNKSKNVSYVRINFLKKIDFGKYKKIINSYKKIIFINFV